MKKHCFLLIILMLCLTGCTPVRDTRDISHQRVLSIQVTTETPAGLLRRCYTSPEQIHRLLHTLRLEKKAPRSAQANHKLRLELCCADGSRKRYHRLQADDALWTLILSTPGQPGPLPSPTDPPLPRGPWHRAYFPALRRCKIPYK